MYFSVCVLVHICAHFYLSRQKERANLSTLRFVHLVFRHGDRSPYKAYPNSPHQEHKFLQGFGQMTQLGMRQQYSLGQYLRSRYDGFLSKLYLKHQIYVRSTDYDRALQSASCVLAGLYPPCGTQQWHSGVPWQPIPVHSTAPNDDRLMGNAAWGTESYKKYLKEVLEGEESLQYQRQHKDFLAMLRRNTCQDDADFFTLLETIPDLIYTAKNQGLELPAWCSDDVYDKIIELYEVKHHFFFYTPEMRRLHAGTMLDKMMNDMRDKINENTTKAQKVAMYSGHDSTIEMLLTSLELWDRHLPVFSACLMFELHELQRGDYTVRIIYKNGADSTPLQLQLKGCEPDCKFEQFMKIVKPLTISSEEQYMELSTVK